MDNSETYIKMCEKTEEIQKLCTWDMGHDFFGKIPVGKVLFKSVWLPRQDQLQAMYSKDLYTLLHDFDMWIEFYTDGSDKYETMEQLWLAFVMKAKFHKKWDGNDWIELP